MKRLLISVALIGVLGLLISGCTSPDGAPAGNTIDPAAGVYAGTTSQGQPITIVVVQVGDAAHVTDVKYTIEMQGSGWTVTSELHQPHKIDALVTDGRFSNMETLSSGIEEISGAFYEGGSLEGRLRCTDDHPQGLGTAVGEVTFTATKQ